MKNLTKLILLTGILLFTVSCMITGVVGSNNVTTETRTITEDFTGIKVSQGIEIQLTQAKDKSLSIEMDDNLHELLVTEVIDGTLKIYFKENVNKRKASTIYLTMPDIKTIKTSSGSEVIGKNTLQTDDLVLDASSGSEISLRLEATNITAESSSGSEINLKGTTNSLLANSSSGSQIDADNLIANTVTAKVSSGADINVQAKKSITAKARSGGSIDCNGTPNERVISKSSGGSVRVN